MAAELQLSEVELLQQIASNTNVICEEGGEWRKFNISETDFFKHVSENSGVEASVAGEGETRVPGLFKITTNKEGHVTAVEQVTKQDILDLGITEGSNYTHPTFESKESGLYKIEVEGGHVKSVTAVTKEDITKLGIPGQDTTYNVGGDNLGLVKNGGNVTINPDGTMTAPECAVKYKYFNFIEPGVNVAGNPTYDEIKEAILSDVTPVLIDGHYIASMTSGHWDAEAFEREELPGFTFVTHRSDMNNHWKVKYTEFWCTKQDDGSTLWVVGEHCYIEDFVAQYGVTTFSEIQNAYNHEKIMFCTDSWFVAKLDLFAPDYYAQFSGLDNLGNPVLLKVTKDNVWTNTYAEKATPDYVDSEINKVNATIANQKTFVAEYGTTTYEELLNAYASKRQLVLRIPANTLDGVSEMYANLTSNNGNSFNFICLDWSNTKYRFYAYRNNNDTIWEHNEGTLAEYDYAKIIDDNFKNFVNTTNNTLNNYNTNIDSLFKLVYGFRGGMCDNAGTLHIKNPGIYLILQAGKGNKKIAIVKDGNRVLYKEWDSIILLAYESGAITPIGFNGSTLFSGAIETPGTYQGWTGDENCSTTIDYPAGCVVAYLGNSKVDYLA